ncbi:MAG TPA: hypothetical protein VGD98_08085 [Ktedonobacteraceae bacterium]
MIALIFLSICALVTLVLALASYRTKDKPQPFKIRRAAPPLMPRGFMTWRYGNWSVGERVNETINAGKQQHAQKRSPREKSHSRRYR